MHGRLRVGVPTSDQFSFVNFTLVGSGAILRSLGEGEPLTDHAGG